MVFIVMTLFVIAVLFIVSAILELLWNMTMPDVFDLKKINYWQALRLIIISAILFSPSLIGCSPNVG